MANEIAREHKRIEQERAMARLGRLAASQSEPPVLMDQATALVSETLGVQFSGILELGQAGQPDCFKSLSGAPGSSPMDGASPPGPDAESADPLAAHAARLGSPVVVNRVADETQLDVSLLLRWGVASAAAVPLKLDDQPYGALAAYSTAPCEFSSEDIYFLEAVSSLVTIAIERAQAVSKLLEAERMAAIGQMVSGLAHESRNALQQIGACAEMLAMELEHMPEALDLVSGVQDAQARLHRLFDDMRAYAIPLRFHLCRVNLADVWRGAWSELTAVRAERKLTLTEHCQGVDLGCAIDAPFMKQAFYHLLENAVDASSDPAEIEIHGQGAQLDGRPAVRISVVDHGVGLTPEQRQNVQRPFYTTKTRGTGLGLAIVRRIVEGHGGQFDIGDARRAGAEMIVILRRDG